uniref:Uncharacterized protein n=1 Tax=Quercus lobata TaxID=97700 RepID=A0A7N2LBD1_QUELO
MRIVKGRGGQNGTSIIDGDGERKKINIGSKGVVFLFLRSGNGPSRVNSQVLQKPIWVVLVHLLLLWVCHGLIDYRVHHEVHCDPCRDCFEVFICLNPQYSMPITIHALLELWSNIASQLSSGRSFIMSVHKSA